jgi:hypothetical protein
MAGKAKIAHRRKPVYIRHASGKYVNCITHGYVSEPYANLGAKPAEYLRWEAERFVNKWLSPEKAAEYTIVDATP